jgi:hypothetical protein
MSTPQDVAEQDQAQASMRHLANIVAGTIAAYEDTGMSRDEAAEWAMLTLGPVIERQACAVDVP